jgi:hypothetical protein
MRARALVLALALAVAQPACAGVTHNQRDGLIAIGGVGVLMGTLMTIDGASCSSGDDVISQRRCRDEDHHVLALGITTFVAGLIVGGGALLLHPRGD